MSFSTFSGPVRSGTVREGASKNTGVIVLSQSKTVAMSGVALTASPVAQTLFTLPAGSQILNFVTDVTVAIAGNGVTQVAATIGKSGAAAEYAASFNTGITVGRLSQATIDAATASKVVALNNIGTADVPVTATFTATTGNPTSGTVVVTVVYAQRATDGTY